MLHLGMLPVLACTTSWLSIAIFFFFIVPRRAGWHWLALLAGVLGGAMMCYGWTRWFFALRRELNAGATKTAERAV
jgi:hypothetical protein